MPQCKAIGKGKNVNPSSAWEWAPAWFAIRDFTQQDSPYFLGTLRPAQTKERRPDGCRGALPRGKIRGRENCSYGFVGVVAGAAAGAGFGAAGFCCAGAAALIG